MALTISKISEFNAGPGLRSVFFTATFDSSYPTGGEAVDFSASTFNFNTRVYGCEALSCTLTAEIAKGIPVYLNDDLTDLDGGTLLMMDGGSETADTTDLSASVWTFRVDGY